MRDFTDILEDLVNSMDLTIAVESVTGDKIFVCETLHLRERRVIEDELGNKYTVVDVLNDKWIRVTPLSGAPDPFEGKTVVCPPVTFLSGTPLSLDGDFLSISVKSGDKTPLIWLLEPYREREFGIKSSIERETIPKIFFLDETNEKDGLTTKEHHKQSIQPMLNLSKRFFLTVQNDRMFKSIEEIGNIPRVRFGKHIDDEGNTDFIIDEYLSGVERQPTMMKYKKLGCEC